MVFEVEIFIYDYWRVVRVLLLSSFFFPWKYLNLIMTKKKLLSSILNKKNIYISRKIFIYCWHKQLQQKRNKHYSANKFYYCLGATFGNKNFVGDETGLYIRRGDGSIWHAIGGMTTMVACSAGPVTSKLLCLERLYSYSTFLNHFSGKPDIYCFMTAGNFVIRVTVNKF